MFKLTKDFRFESAHRLAKGYQGKCANIHGHSWNGSITISVRSSDLDQYGFGIDYNDIKDFLKPLEDSLDHAILLHDNDREIIDLCKKNNWKVVIFTDNPTSEIVAKRIYEKAEAYFKEKFSNCKVENVTINETCTSSCEYTGL